MNGWKQLSALAGLALALGLCACNKKPDPSPAAGPVATNEMVFQVKGRVRELKPGGRQVVIAHEAVANAVTNYMPAMTMPFDVRDTNELRGLKPDDWVTFQMTVIDSGQDSTAWISHVTKLAAPPGTALPSRSQLYLTRDVDLLSVGDALPAYHFTNELGQVVSTEQFKGQALVFTFFFTACPYPTFCPYLSNGFEAVQKKLLAQADGPRNWHLLSISFDTEHDSPAVLKEYGGRYQNDPAFWSLATGDRVEITAIGDQVGFYFGHDENGGVTHNLRTVVLDTKGRIQKVYTNNNWTTDDLAAEIVKAALVK